MNEWISVKEKMPEDGCDVLFCYKMNACEESEKEIYRIACGFFDGSNYQYDCWKGFICDPCWEACSIEIPLRYVTHWMPLPILPFDEREITTMPFGKYQGRLLSELPKDYVQWLVASGSLQREEAIYLRDRFKKLGFIS